MQLVTYSNIAKATFCFSLLLLVSACQKESVLPAQRDVVEGTFSQALYLPPVVQADDARLSIHAAAGSGTLGLNALSYQNAPIGPVIESRSGQSARITFANAGAVATNIHWHGLLVPADMDGHPDLAVAPGQTKEFTFTMNQRASTTWYHPHLHGSTGEQLTKGLAGMWIHRDDAEKGLNLPAGEHELPLIIQDKRIDSQGNIVYNPTPEEIATGYFGDKVTVNGIQAPFHKVKAGWYRLRIVNASTARIYNLSLNNGRPMFIIGNDGGLLSQVISQQEAILSPGERLDVLVDFSGMAPGKSVFLVSNPFRAGVQGNQFFKILRFEVSEGNAPSFSLPASMPLLDLENPAVVRVTRSFDIGISHDEEHGGGHTGHGGGTGTTSVGHTINGKLFDPVRIDETASAGDLEIWEFDNTLGDEAHPMHVHGARFQVLSREGGRAQVLPFERGWKDTVLCLPGEKVRVLVRFGAHTGKFVFHCHNVEHGDDGMMLNLQLQ